MNELSLKGKNVELIPNNDAESNNNSKKFTNQSNHMELSVKLIDSDNNIGKICSYNYNQIDGYVYIFIDISNEKFFYEALELFINYLFSCFTIRKIYYQVYEHQLSKNTIQGLKDLKFEIEANLKEDNYYDGKYLCKYIFALYRQNFYKEKK